MGTDETPRYIGGMSIDFDDRIVEQWGVGVALMDAITRFVHKRDPHALDRWADDGGRA